VQLKTSNCQVLIDQWAIKKASKIGCNDRNDLAMYHVDKVTVQFIRTLD